MTFSAGVLGKRDPAGNGFTNSMRYNIAPSLASMRHTLILLGNKSEDWWILLRAKKMIADGRISSMKLDQQEEDFLNGLDLAW